MTTIRQARPTDLQTPTVRSSSSYYTSIPLDLVNPCTRVAGGSVFSYISDPAEFRRRAAAVIGRIQEGWLRSGEGGSLHLGPSCGCPSGSSGARHARQALSRSLSYANGVAHDPVAGRGSRPPKATPRLQKSCDVLNARGHLALVMT